MYGVHIFFNDDRFQKTHFMYSKIVFYLHLEIHNIKQIFIIVGIRTLIYCHTFQVDIQGNVVINMIFYGNHENPVEEDNYFVDACFETYETNTAIVKVNCCKMYVNKFLKY